MNDYIHKVNYYETDKMGITHHSNYIRWMEEARVDYLEQIGMGYAKLEKDGIVSPVIGVECQYKRPTTFGDEIRIHVEIAEFKRIELIIAYTITNHQTGDLVLTGQ
ncbi:MAG: acyl-CoA thioesterase, partial [Clostridia bacterium]|nr:acyl-CoA thioesterase [Clostridia bacterium]